MLKMTGFAALALLGALAIGPANAAPQFSGTNDEPGTGSDHTIDCSDAANRFSPYCEMVNGQLGGAAPTTEGRRLNSLDCPSGNLVAAGEDANGNRLYRCSTTRNGRALDFLPAY